ncbi:amino acid/polyamine/organocation transporter (APC superfamily) [Paraburkholderia sp. BL23I1N1]|uniref:APC family permease n=1 Tax=Paraburkholderia sp. BL23I1N1 TaxID=1938802 RepID=UPI000FF55F1C|nr:APC family permease [Paraburkholderia sp. BL23I1N1]RKE23870.1 amino acid/polyamine/organocation transporter (APC superfamily) [Paraburkholderia sp. BL23I1N1]
MDNVTNSQALEDAVSNSSKQARLSGRMGTTSLMLTVLAFAAPMAVVAGYLPFTIVADGPGASLALCLTTAILLLFTVGYVTMTRHVPKPGDFYAFISSGLGNVSGLGAAFLAVISYVALLLGGYVFFGISVSSAIVSVGGVQAEWWEWSLLGWIAVSALGYLHIELSAKVLSVSMMIEIAIVMIFNVAVIHSGGADGLSVEPFTPSAFIRGDVGVTLLYAILLFVGFEATALFRDELVEPDRTIPRATYGAVILVGLLYTLSCYALVSAYGQHVWDIAKNDPASMFAHAIGIYAGRTMAQVTQVFVIMSVLASLISIHNVLSRYVFNLAADRAFPKYFSSVHSQHRSPHAASNLIAFVALLLIGSLVFTHANSAETYGMAAGIGGLGVVVLMAMVSYSAVAWFVRNGMPKEENAFKTLIAPGISAILLTLTAIFGVIHLDLVVGGKPGEYEWVTYFLLAAFALGSLVAFYFRCAMPEVYQNLGRAERVFEFLANRQERTDQLSD